MQLQLDLDQQTQRTSSKVCRKCGVRKDLTQFSKDRSRKDGLAVACKVCDRARQKARNKANPSLKKARNAKSDDNRRRRRNKETYGIEDPKPSEMYKDRYGAAREHGFRSGLEIRIDKQLTAAGVQHEYETKTITYVIPEAPHRYTPDFPLPNGIVIEGKGQFTSDDRKKMKLVREQHPDIDIRFIFSSSRTRIGKKSKTTYGDWCTRLGFKYSDKLVPQAWLDEPVNQKSLDALEAACR